jgi:hypothetical protein
LGHCSIRKNAENDGQVGRRAEAIGGNYGVWLREEVSRDGWRME